MMAGVLIIALCLCSCLSPSDARYYGTIFSKEHFHDVVTKPGSTIAARSAVLVFYQPSCYPPLSYKNVAHHLLYLLHDYSMSTNYIWFNRDEKDLLRHQFLSKESPCLSALYIRKGDSVQTPTETWSGEPDFALWFWSHLSTKVIVKNKYNQAIKVVQENLGGGPELNAIEIPQDSEATVETYIGYLLHISELSTSTLIDAVMVTDDLTEIMVSEKKTVNIPSIKNEDQDKYKLQRGRVWNHGERHLRMAKQPLVVHNYTEKGYAVLPIPRDLYANLHQFYHDHRNHSLTEVISRTDAAHQNIGLRSPGMIDLTAALKNSTVDSLQPLLEEWSKTKLSQAIIYGVREYYNGNVLFNHVDMIKTRVIAAILQIDQDRGGQEDWPLEVIDYNGRRQQVKLLPGEMLFYESAKIIHGRPKPFQGISFANTLAHFAPVEGWDYRYDNGMYRSELYGLKEPLEDLQTDLAVAGTVVGNIVRVRDEL